MNLTFSNTSAVSASLCDSGFVPNLAIFTHLSTTVNNPILSKAQITYLSGTTTPNTTLGLEIATANIHQVIYT